MSRPDYWQIRKTEPRVRHMAAIGAALGIDPDERAGAMRIVEFALAQTYLGLARGKKQEESMYQGEDRNRQVAWLRNVAADIAFGAVGEGTPEEQVAYWCETNELPAWFDDHDRDLLVQFAS